MQLLWLQLSIELILNNLVVYISYDPGEIRTPVKYLRRVLPHPLGYRAKEGTPAC